MRSIVKRGFQRLGLEIRRAPVAPDTPKGLFAHASFSRQGEQQITSDLLREIGPEHRVCVDIGASDGVEASKSVFLFHSGWTGLCVEGAAENFARLADSHTRFPNVNLTRIMVGPVNVVSLLTAHGIPRELGYLTLEIDSYDYFVLRAILEEFRPRLICTQINETIPPPLKFTVRYDPAFSWGFDQFRGQSISQVQVACEDFDYSIVGLEYNSAFLMANEALTRPALSAEEAYARGYRDRPDRREKYPWNDPMEDIMTMSPEMAIQELRRLWAEHEGRFELTY